MEIELIKVKEEEKNILKNLLEYYSYDFSNYYEYDLNENGKFELIDIMPYFKNNGSEAFFIKVNEKKVGFILVGKENNIKEVDEFWIMPKYRKGMMAYKILKEFLKMIEGRFIFGVLNNNERWLKSIEYMIIKNNKICKIVGKRQVIYTFKWGKYEFTEFLIECTK